MRVTTSCSGRFHIFDEARQLHRHGVLYQLICDYPKFMTRRWGIPDEKVKSLLANGVYSRMANRVSCWVPSWFHNVVAQSVHDRFSRRVARYIPQNSDVFLGLSSFCLEGIRAAKEHGAFTVVEHGSLHQRYERRILEEEKELLGLPPDETFVPQWIIDKEDREYELTDRIIVLSEVARRSFIEEGVPAKKLFVNHCGVDLRNFTPGTKTDRIFRIIFCGAGSVSKGVYYLLKAFSELKLPHAELWVIGKRSLNSAYQNKLRKYCTDKVRFLGSLPQQKLRRFYIQGSVLVLPSLADGFGMVVPQAMACGLPVIVTQNVGASDVVTHGGDGYIIPIRDVEALKQHLLRLYETPELVKSMRETAALSAVSRLSWDAYGDRLVERLNQWLDGQGQLRQAQG